MRKNAAILKTAIIFLAIAVLSFGLAGDSSATLKGEALMSSASLAEVNAKSLYRANCAFCHAGDGKGTEKMRANGAPNFTDAKWHKSRTDAQLAESIKNGKGKFMPSWKKKLNDEQVSALVSFVRAFGRKN